MNFERFMTFLRLHRRKLVTPESFTASSLFFSCIGHCRVTENVAWSRKDLEQILQTFSKI